MKRSFDLLFAGILLSTAAQISGCASGANVTKPGSKPGPSCEDASYREQNPSLCRVEPKQDPTPGQSPTTSPVPSSVPSPEASPAASQSPQPQPTVTETVVQTIIVTPTPSVIHDEPQIVTTPMNIVVEIDPPAPAASPAPAPTVTVTATPAAPAQPQQPAQPPVVASPSPRPFTPIPNNPLNVTMDPITNTSNSTLPGCDPANPRATHVFNAEITALTNETGQPTLELPYKVETINRSVHMGSLNFGQMSGTYSGTIGSERATVPYVKDSMLTFKLDLIVPSKEATPTIASRGSELNIAVVKVGKDRVENQATELFCFTNEKVCSGYKLRARSWLPIVNDTFWGGSSPGNSYFASQIMALNSTRATRIRTSQGVQEVWRSDAMTLSLAELLGGNHGMSVQNEEAKSESMVRFLYADGQRDSLPQQVPNPGTVQNGWMSKTIYGVVADDTLIRRGGLKITMTYDSCVARSRNYPSVRSRSLR